MTTASFPLQNPPKCNLPDTHIVAGRFVTNATGNNDPAIVSGKGYTVARQETGVFRVTFNRKVKVITLVANVAQPSPLFTCHHKEIEDANNYVDVVMTDYTGTEDDGNQNTEMIDFIAVVMLTTSLPD